MSHNVTLQQIKDCNPRIPNPGIPTVFTNPESQGWRRPNPGISKYKNLLKSHFFARQMTKITF